MKKLNLNSFNKFENLKLENEQSSKIRGGLETCSNKKTSHFTAEEDKQDNDTEQSSDPETAVM
jgi:hypothetical protein|tara:strand:- start:1853 stop:2041 length:189 start_codon:yes stop_codon:yes gene_type:complete